MRYAIVLSVFLIGCTTAPGNPTPVTSPEPPTPVSTPLGKPQFCAYHQAADGQPLPDPTCTPGANDPNVTQDNIQDTICKSGWSASVRPPVSFTEPLKLQSMQQYRSQGKVSDFEYDHLVSLELGGAPRDTKNLWPEPGNSPNEKDKVENAAHKAVCNGTITLDHAQQGMEHDWTELGKELGISGL